MFLYLFFIILEVKFDLEIMFVVNALHKPMFFLDHEFDKPFHFVNLIHLRVKVDVDLTENIGLEFRCRTLLLLVFSHEFHIASKLNGILENRRQAFEPLRLLRYLWCSQQEKLRYSLLSLEAKMIRQTFAHLQGMFCLHTCESLTAIADPLRCLVF